MNPPAYGLKVVEISRGRFEARICEQISGHSTLEAVIGAMLAARAALPSEFTKLHREMQKIARSDTVCQRLMSVPDVGARVATTYRSAVDDPARFGKSSRVDAYFGLIPGKYQSGETSSTGYGMTLPGLSRFCGSSAAFSRRINAISTSDRT